MKKIILASSSPRRQELLKQIEIPFEVLVVPINEENETEINPSKLVKKLSYKKAKSVAEKFCEPSIIIGADTVVTYNNKILGKPKNEKDAFQMLSILSGRKHSVFTGVTIIDIEKEILSTKYIIESTDVYMREINEEEIWDYIKTGESFDKAGGYGIQGKGAVFIDKINGDYYTVVGLPLTKLYLELKKYYLSPNFHKLNF